MQKMMKKILLLLHNANLDINKLIFKGYSMKYGENKQKMKMIIRLYNKLLVQNDGLGVE